MKTGIFIDEHMTARKLLESLASSLTDQYGKNYYRLEATMEQVGEETFVVHFDNEEDVPEYLTAVRTEFLANKHLRNLSEPGKDFMGASLLLQHLLPGTRVVCSDDKEYIIAEGTWDGKFVRVDPAEEGGLAFYKADIELIRLIN
jgi:hypothetical protein